MQQCDYCEGTAAILNNRNVMSYKGDFFPGVEICVDGHFLSFVCVADTYEPNYTGVTAKIKFCPMCGRKLPERSDE